MTATPKRTWMGVGGIVAVATIVVTVAALAFGGTEGSSATTAATVASGGVSMSTTTTAEATSTSIAVATTSDDSTPIVSETSYAGSTVAVTIETVTSGSGSDAVTYYVADVVLGPGTSLQTALATDISRRGAADTSDIAAANDAVVAINADYYAARDDGIIIRDGEILRDVPVRIGLAFYADGTMEAYDETTTSAADLLAAGVTDTISFGPALLVDGTIGDNLSTVEVEANPRHPIQGAQPRAGIGMIEPGHFVFVVVDGRSPGYSRGVTLTEFAEIFSELGATTAYNLDGGGSATLVFMGDVVNIPLGRGDERAVGDILFVG